MMSSRRRNSLLVVNLALACAGAGLLTGCDDAPPPQDPAATPRRAVAVIESLAPEMVSAVSAGANSTIVGVHFALRATPEVGKALPVDIAVVPHREFTSLRAHFEAHDGLAIATGDTLAAVKDPKAEKAQPHQLVVLPSRDGVFMISAIVETEGAEGNITRVYSIPVIVAPPAPAAGAPPTPANPDPAAAPAPATS